MAEIKLSGENFQKEVYESEVPVLVDFWAPWCGPCQKLSPIIAEIAEEHPEIKVGKVNVDEEPELADQFNVMSIPYIVYFKNGQIASSTIGYNSKEVLEEMLK